jgi:hypothetical protein
MGSALTTPGWWLRTSTDEALWAATTVQAALQRVLLALA